MWNFLPFLTVLLNFPKHKQQETSRSIHLKYTRQNERDRYVCEWTTSLIFSVYLIPYLLTHYQLGVFESASDLCIFCKGQKIILIVYITFLIIVLVTIIIIAYPKLMTATSQNVYNEIAIQITNPVTRHMEDLRCSLLLVKMFSISLENKLKQCFHYILKFFSNRTYFEISFANCSSIGFLPRMFLVTCFNAV